VIGARLWSNCSQERRRFVPDLVESLLYGKERKNTIGFWRIHKITVQHRFNMSNFDPNAILRGAQLTFVGGERTAAEYITNKTWRLSANRALLNPQVFKHAHYRQAALAVLAGVLIRLIMEIPVRLLTCPITYKLIINTWLGSPHQKFFLGFRFLHSAWTGDYRSRCARHFTLLATLCPPGSVLPDEPHEVLDTGFGRHVCLLLNS